MSLWGALVDWWTRRAAEQALAEAERRHREIVERRKNLERYRDLMRRSRPAPPERP